MARLAPCPRTHGSWRRAFTHIRDPRRVPRVGNDDTVAGFVCGDRCALALRGWLSRLFTPRYRCRDGQCGPRRQTNPRAIRERGAECQRCKRRHSRWHHMACHLPHLSPYDPRRSLLAPWLLLAPRTLVATCITARDHSHDAVLRLGHEHVGHCSDRRQREDRAQDCARESGALSSACKDDARAVRAARRVGRRWFGVGARHMAHCVGR